MVRFISGTCSYPAIIFPTLIKTTSFFCFLFDKLQP
uniref:Uncharacterized protein n=1 Tax=Anguilla anguilla TaxID=7936 RepID=A0A0E9SUK7_ANGAN